MIIILFIYFLMKSSTNEINIPSPRLSRSNRLSHSTQHSPASAHQSRLSPVDNSPLLKTNARRLMKQQTLNNPANPPPFDEDFNEAANRDAHTRVDHFKDDLEVKSQERPIPAPSAESGELT